MSVKKKKYSSPLLLNQNSYSLFLATTVPEVSMLSLDPQVKGAVTRFNYHLGHDLAGPCVSVLGSLW